jgi:ribulose-5-phosphate 4-epimerase/fuculose-1-phosphate aldolase
VVRRGLTWGAAGNLSVRLDGGRFLVTASGVRLDELGPDALVTCRLDEEAPDERAEEGGGGPGVRPSVETAAHRAVYAAVPAAGAVLHTSAPYTTLVACSRLRVPVRMNTDGMIYVGPVVRVPFRHPGTPELARAAAAAARRSRVLLLSNHGSLVWGASPEETLTRTEALELVSRLLVTARASGLPLALVPEAEARRYADRHRV